MRRPIRTVFVVVVAASVVSSSCGADLLEAFQGALNSNWSLSPDKTLQAAGNTDAAIAAERTAKQKLEDGIANADADLIEKAAEDRPNDPKYAAHLAGIRAAQGDRRAMSATDELTDRVGRQHPDASDIEVKRRAAEVYYDALHDMIVANADFSGRDRLKGFYCEGIKGAYAKFYRASAPAEVALYLEFADFSLCG